MKSPVRIAVTGAAGQISYSLLFRLLAGDLFGLDQPLILHLLDVPEAESALQGVVMELHDCASPRLAGIVSTSEPDEAFADIDYAFLVGSRPRGPGMERRDLLESNGKIFSVQGKALDRQAKRSVKVLVIGNPANTNALIAMRNAPGLDSTCFSAMTRLDHNRAVSALAVHLATDVSAISRVAIWGNHSPTQYPDLHQASMLGKPVMDMLDSRWYRDTYIPMIQQRGAAVIQQRGRSSAASAANAAIDHMWSWCYGTPEDDWVSMAVPSDGCYGVESGLVYSFPVRCRAGRYEIVRNLPMSEWSGEKLEINAAELRKERDMIRGLIG